MQQTAPLPVEATYRAAIWLCHVLYILIGFGWSMIGPVLPSLRAEFNLDLAAVALVFPAMMVGYIAGIILAGYCIDVYGRRPVLVACAVLLGCGLIGWGLASSWYLTLFFVACAGAGLGCIDIAGNIVVAEASAEHKVANINRLHTFFGLGALSGPLLIGALVAFNWRLPFWTVGLASLLTLPVVLAAQLPRPGKLDPVSVPVLLDLVRQPLVIIVAATLALYVGAEVIAVGWSVIFLTDEFQVPQSLASTSVTAFWGAVFLGRLLTAYLSRRLPVEPLLQVPLLCSFPLIILLALSPAPWVVYAGVIGVGLCFAAIFPTLYALTLQAYPRSPGAISTVLTLGASLGSMLPPYLAGVMGEAWGMQWAMLLMLPLMLVTPALVHLAFQHIARHTARAPVAAGLAQDADEGVSA